MKFKYWLTSLTDISNAKKKLLHDCSITAEKLFFMPKNELFDILFFTDDDRKIILESRASYDVEKEWILFQQKDIGFVTMEDEAYPDKLRNIHNPPYSLFYIGALPDKSRKSVAIVGARGRSAYGCEVAKVLAAALSRQGIQIISGMARGIDRDAHMGCLEAGGNTYAVLGSGADTCYPKENRFLYDKIKLSGGIISELMPGTDPQKMFFPMRNRIISGLSDIVVIVEAKKRSGSLITADFAMEQGKDIYAVPGRVTDALSMGCNNLIRQGAGIINSVEDFVKDLELYTCIDTTQENFNKLLLEKDESLVYACLSLRPKSMEELLKKTGFEMPQMADVLQRLIQKDFITESFKNYYIRKI